MTGREFYNLDDLILNIDLKTGERNTSWGNLGYWSVESGTHYPNAAKQLAIELGRFIALNDRDHVFDVGYGCGDQVGVWTDYFGVESVVGVNLSESQSNFARQNIVNNHVRLSQGDACDEGSWKNITSKTNAILALDCLYHFENKPVFFQLCANQLTQGQGHSRFACTDLILVNSTIPLFQKLILKAICRLSYIPFKGLKTLEAYQADLQTVGLKLDRHRDISENVMDGFADWLPVFQREFRQSKHKSLPNVSWAKYKGVAWFLKWLRKQKILEYHLLLIK